MELNRNNKPCIIGVGIGGWYAAGIDRLEKSLLFHGFPGDTLFWRDTYPPGSPSHADNPYYFKVAAFEWALWRGYTNILYLDASFWAIQNPIKIFDFFISNGIYIFRTGYSLAQTVNDVALERLGYSRDMLVDTPEYASGCVGLNFNNPDARQLYTAWKDYMDQGLSRGSRLHDGQSQDPRFLFHRQDQSCLSLAMYKLKLLVNEPDFVAYYGGGYNPSKCLFFINGL